jgi:protein-S-isoprenylcysteine O-methyltransferase Ste14
MTASPLVVLPALFWRFQARLAVHEEAQMQRPFGARYQDYRRRL